MNNVDDKNKKTRGGISVACPDPLWPVDAEPVHLTPEQKREATVVGTFVALKEADWKCEKCGVTTGASEDNPRLCRRCATADKLKPSLMKKTNSSWMEEAKEMGLEVFERQPEETTTEWRIWDMYRSYYPMKLPTWSELASRLGVSQSTVVAAAHKWNFKVRIIDWARYCDAAGQEDRVKAVQEVHASQKRLAETMLEKVREAMDSIQPEYMKPNEIVNLAKLATEMQRRSTEYIPEKVAQPAIVDKVSAAQEVTKPEDLAEIAEILSRAGALGQTVGIERTTRVVIKGGNDE